jgi:nicotinamide phosphoribosyltransferase
MVHVLANTDSYKLSHKGFMEPDTEIIYANLTARSFKHFPINGFDGKAVFFNLQAFCKEYLIDEWNREFFNKPLEEVIYSFKVLVDGYLGIGAVPMDHFIALHKLGYLPIEIKALPEGSRVDVKVPFLTIKNTHKKFAWLTNFLETVMSCELWKSITTATIAYQYRKLINKFALETTGSLDFTNFQCHDFSFRGQGNRHEAAANGAAFLLSSNGTDTIPAIPYLIKYYGADPSKEFIATSVPATEHSIQCGGTAVRGEYESFLKWITQDYPTGVVSLVSDGFDYWKVITQYLPLLKPYILARPVNEIGLSKVVIRPDSGDPVKIVTGYTRNEIITGIDGKLYRQEDITVIGFDHYPKKGVLPLSEAEIKGSIEILWEIFGGTITEQGYKLLDSHIGLIYGDSITYAIAEEIMTRLKAKGFASTNIVFGVGSYTLQFLTRDSLGMAVKATYTEVGGKGYELFKDPVTDSGMKKSAKGLLRVEKEGDNFVLYDQQTWEQEAQGELKVVFKDGQLYNETTLSEIRNRLWSN